MDLQIALEKEIDIIQSCINRMSSNSFMCKGWNLTLITGVVSLPKDINYRWLILIIISINACFWFLDSFFVLQEQRFRDKYKWIITERLKSNAEYLYDLDPNNPNTTYRVKKRKLYNTILSKTIAPMYGGILFLALLFIFFN